MNAIYFQMASRSGPTSNHTRTVCYTIRQDGTLGAQGARSGMAYDESRAFVSSVSIWGGDVDGVLYAPPEWTTGKSPQQLLDTVYAALRGSGRVFLRPRPYQD